MQRVSHRGEVYIYRSCWDGFVDTISKIMRAIGRILCCNWSRQSQIHETRSMPKTMHAHTERQAQFAFARAQLRATITTTDGLRTMNFIKGGTLDLAHLPQVGGRDEEGTFLPAKLRFYAALPPFQASTFPTKVTDKVAECAIYYLVFQPTITHRRLSIVIPGSSGKEEVGMFNTTNVVQPIKRPLPLDCYGRAPVNPEEDGGAFNWEQVDQAVQLIFGRRKSGQSILAHITVLPPGDDFSDYEGPTPLDVRAITGNADVMKLFTFEQDD